MSSPKITLIGAGSLFFGRKAIWQMVHSPHLREGTLALVDTDTERLDKMKRQPWILFNGEFNFNSGCHGYDDISIAK